MKPVWRWSSETTGGSWSDLTVELGFIKRTFLQYEDGVVMDREGFVGMLQNVEDHRAMKPHHRSEDCERKSWKR